jgi:tight adherence protein C
MLVIGLVLVGMALVALTSALGIVGVSTKPVRRRLQARLAQGVEGLPGRAVLADDAGMGWARFVVPKRTVTKVDRRLQLAGRPDGWNVRRFVTVKAISTLLASLLALLVAASDLKPLTVVLAGLLVFIGRKAPDVILDRVATNRQNAIRKALPDVLDQTTVSIESGLSMEGALARVSDGAHSALGDEFARTLQDMRVGMSRKDAYEALADRTDVEDLRHFVKSIMQADEFGVSVAKIVATQAADIRIKRRFEAEARALQVPVKMLFPLLICLFPALFVVVLTPAVINLSETIGR